MKVGIYYSDNNGQSVKLVRRFKRLLIESKIEAVEILKEKVLTDDFTDIDLIAVLGGDGTVLSGVKIADGQIPVVAINTGTVGFLTAFEKDNLQEVVKQIKNNSLVFSERRLLKVSVGNNVYFALNDAVILKDFQKDNFSCCIKLNLEIDKKPVDKYIADGLILSTPTGSTAYALSAGAPVLSPELEAVVVAPICSHSLHSRPIVYSPKSIAKVTVDQTSRDCALYIDGEVVRELCSGEEIEVVLDEKTVKICDNCSNFFEKLSKKIASWSNNE